MNKKKTILYIIYIVFILAACSADKDPRPVAEQFLKAMSVHDYTTAKKFGTKETKKFLSQLQRRDQLFGESQADKTTEIVIVSEEIQGDRATVFFKEKGNELEQKISLRRMDPDTTDADQGKKWKVALRKEEIKLNNNPALDIPKDSVMKKIPS